MKQRYAKRQLIQAIGGSYNALEPIWRPQFAQAIAGNLRNQQKKKILGQK
jgi:hypothetical protein